MISNKKTKKWSKKRNLKSSKATKKLINSLKIKLDRKNLQKPKRHKYQQSKQTLETFLSDRKRKNKPKGSLRQL